MVTPTSEAFQSASEVFGWIWMENNAEGGEEVSIQSTDPPEDEIGESFENNPWKKDLRAEAWKWMERNPDVYALFRRFALEMATKRKRFGIKLLTERVRWECLFLTIKLDEDGFKINNNHTAYIARRLRCEIPELRGLIEFRKTRDRAAWMDAP